MNHRVLVHEILVQFLASDLSLDIRDEVLDVLNGLALLGNEFRCIGRWVIARQKVVEVLVADVENLKEGAKLMSVRHRKRFTRFGTQALASLRRHHAFMRLLLLARLLFNSRPPRFTPDTNRLFGRLEPSQWDGRQCVIATFRRIRPRLLVHHSQHYKGREVHPRLHSCQGQGRSVHPHRLVGP